MEDNVFDKLTLLAEELIFRNTNLPTSELYEEDKLFVIEKSFWDMYAGRPEFYPFVVYYGIHFIKYLQINLSANGWKCSVNKTDRDIEDLTLTCVRDGLDGGLTIYPINKYIKLYYNRDERPSSIYLGILRLFTRHNMSESMVTQLKSGWTKVGDELQVRIRNIDNIPS